MSRKGYFEGRHCIGTNCHHCYRSECQGSVWLSVYWPSPLLQEWVSRQRVALCVLTVTIVTGVRQEQSVKAARGSLCTDRHHCCRFPDQSPSRLPCSALTGLAVASPRIPAGPAMACAAGSSAAVEAVRPGSSMSGREQQDQSASGVGRRRRDGKNHLEAGSSVHKGENKFECQQCDKTFKCKSLLERHTLTHSGVKNHKCIECGKTFTRKSTLTRHTLTHSGVKNYECKDCVKTFTRKSTLTTHTLTHSGVKNYECKDCGKTFTLKSTLTTHTLTHSGVKNYKCEDCGQTFTLKSNLTRHTLTHSGVKKYECDDCGKRFFIVTDLNEHMFRHTGAREFKCDVCKKYFKTKHDIRRHIKIHFWVDVLCGQVFEECM